MCAWFIYVSPTGVDLVELVNFTCDWIAPSTVFSRDGFDGIWVEFPTVTCDPQLHKKNSKLSLLHLKTGRGKIISVTNGCHPQTPLPTEKSKFFLLKKPQTAP